MFADRTDAGEQLAAALVDRDTAADVVLAIPRGALPLGRAVADELDAPLDVVVAKKLGAPFNKELAVGAVSEHGDVWMNEEVIDRAGIDQSYIDRVRETERAAASEKATRYREGEPVPLADERVVVVDDGVATGSTMRACLQAVSAKDPAQVVVAVPVGPETTLAELGEVADDVVALERPGAFSAVGAYYRDFDQVSDSEARAYLE
jgi:predicted phosphoribosyltransferase